MEGSDSERDSLREQTGGTSSGDLAGRASLWPRYAAGAPITLSPAALASADWWHGELFGEGDAQHLLEARASLGQPGPALGQPEPAQPEPALGQPGLSVPDAHVEREARERFGISLETGTPLFASTQALRDSWAEQADWVGVRLSTSELEAEGRALASRHLAHLVRRGDVVPLALSTEAPEELEPVLLASRPAASVQYGPRHPVLHAVPADPGELAALVLRESTERDVSGPATAQQHCALGAAIRTYLSAASTPVLSQVLMLLADEQETRRIHGGTAEDSGDEWTF